MSDARLTTASASSRVASRLALPAQDEDVAALRRAVIAKLTYAVGKDPWSPPSGTGSSPPRERARPHRRPLDDLDPRVHTETASGFITCRWNS